MIKETQLENGLQILTQEDHHQPIVTCMVWYKVGSRHESLGHTGISHFIEHMMFKGTDRFAKGDIDRLTLQSGGYNNAYTWLDATTYYFSFASDRWEQALEIEANRMQHCLFAPEEVAAEKRVILEEWHSADDDPEEKLLELVNCTALTMHPYRHPILGWKQDIENMTPEALEDFYKAYYQPGNATLIVVGDFDTDTLLQRIETLFGPIPQGKPVPELLYAEPEQQGERRVILKDPNVQAPRLCYAYHAPSVFSKDFYALTLIEYLLSEGKSALLYQRMVEELEYASHVDVSFYATYAPFLLSITLDVCQGQKMHKVERSLDQVIASLRKGKIRPKQLQKALNQIEADFYFNQETTEELAETLGEYASLGDWKLAQNYLEKIKAVTLDEVLAVAQKYLSPDRRTVGWLLPDSYQPRSSRLKLLNKRSKNKKAAYTPPEMTHQPFDEALKLPPEPLYKPGVHTTEQGLEIRTLVHPKTPTACIKLWIGGGHVQDPEGFEGLHYLLSQLLLRGSKARSGKDLFEELDFMGAQLRVNCLSNGIVMTLELLSRDIHKGIQLLFECLEAPLLTEKEIKKARYLLQQELIQAEASPNFHLALKLNEVMYAGTPLASPSTGTPTSLKNIQRKDLEQVALTELVPQNIQLTIAGDIQPATLIEQIAQFQWPHVGKSQTHPPVELQEPLKIPQAVAMDKKDQLCLYLAHRGVERTHPDYPALLVLDLILGTSPGFTARIPKRIRDELGLAYTIEASMTQTAGMYPGVFLVYTETSPEHVTQLIQEVKKEILKVQQEGVTDTELKDVQRYFSGNYVFRFETNSQLASSLLQQVIYNWPDHYHKDLLQDILKLTPEDIQQAAQKHLYPEDLTLFCAGPTSELPKELLV